MWCTVREQYLWRQENFFIYIIYTSIYIYLSISSSSRVIGSAGLTQEFPTINLSVSFNLWFPRTADVQPSTPCPLLPIQQIISYGSAAVSRRYGQRCVNRGCWDWSRGWEILGKIFIMQSCTVLKPHLYEKRNITFFYMKGKQLWSWIFFSFKEEKAGLVIRNTIDPHLISTTTVSPIIPLLPISSPLVRPLVVTKDKTSTNIVCCVCDFKYCGVFFVKLPREVTQL